MSSSTDSSRSYNELYEGWIRLRKILQVHHWKLKYTLYQLRVSGVGKLGDEMELPLVDPRDPNYDSDSDEAVVKKKVASGRTVLKMSKPQDSKF